MTQQLLKMAVLCALLVPVGAGCATTEEGEYRGKVTLVEDEQAPEDPFLIKRADLEAALDAGPSWFIQQVAVEAVVVGGRFRGFMLMSAFPNSYGDTPSWLPIQPGDIVQRVNGHRIERPDQFMKVWNDLATREELTVRVVRRNKPLLITWRIQ